MNKELRQLYKRRARVTEMQSHFQRINYLSTTPSLSDLLATKIVAERLTALDIAIDDAWKRFNARPSFLKRIFSR